jgi:hypothetical protein
METKPKPIYSNREDEPQLREPINVFVIGLSETVDSLQDAEAAADFSTLGALCTNLSDHAERLGYAPLAQISAEVSEACREDKSEIARKALEGLTEIARRIRLGHRGSA